MTELSYWQYSGLDWMRYYVAFYIAVASITNYSGWKHLLSSKFLLWQLSNRLDFKRETTECKQTTSLWPPLALEAHTAPQVRFCAMTRSPSYQPDAKFSAEEFCKNPSPVMFSFYDHQNESPYLFNLVLITRLPVTTYLQTWKWLLKWHYTQKTIIICYKWIIPK